MSVVVPVFNPGPEIEPCIASLRAQSLPASEYEVIFVDDGSTDGTAARLDAVAEANPNMRVIHIEASGAPGRPRNTGLDGARGRYVIFLDADDELAPAALERMADWADRHRSDVVIGKYASAAQPRGQAIFARNRGRMTLQSTPVLLDSSLGATKLFRVDLLREAGIRFPEGWRLMEDQYVVLRAYFRAHTISLLADQTYAYFRRRATGDHLSAQPLDPATDLLHLREILDMVESETEPGPLRARAIRRLYRAEILSRLADEPYLELEPSYRHELFVAARQLAGERIDPTIDDDLNAMARLRSTLLRDGRENELLELARRTAGIELRARVRLARWEHGRLRIEFSASLVDRESGRPITVSGRGGRMLLDPLLTDGLVPAPVEIDEELAAVRGNIMLRERHTAAEWLVPTRLSLSFRAVGGPPEPDARRPAIRGVAAVDPRRIGPAGAALDDGSWGVRLRLSLMGLDRRTMPVVDGAATAADFLPAIVGDPVIVVNPTIHDGVWLDVSRSGPVPHALRDEAGTRDRASGPRLSIRLPIASDIGLGPLRGQLLVVRASGVEQWPAEAHHRLGGLVLRANPRSGPPGPVELRAKLDVLPSEVRFGQATVLADGSIQLGPETTRAEPTRLESSRWLASRALDEGRQLYERGVRLAMPLLRRGFEATPRRLRAPLLNATRFLRR